MKYILDFKRISFNRSSRTCQHMHMSTRHREQQNELDMFVSPKYDLFLKLLLTLPKPFTISTKYPSNLHLIPSKSSLLSPFISINLANHLGIRESFPRRSLDTNGSNKRDWNEHH